MQYREAKTPTSMGKKLDHIRLSEGEDGGHVAEHHYHEDGNMFHKPKTYAFGADEGKDLMDHIRKHMHVNPESTVEKPDMEREEEEV